MKLSSNDYDDDDGVPVECGAICQKDCEHCESRHSVAKANIFSLAGALVVRPRPESHQLPSPLDEQAPVGKTAARCQLGAESRATVVVVVDDGDNNAEGLSSSVI